MADLCTGDGPTTVCRGDLSVPGESMGYRPTGPSAPRN